MEGFEKYIAREDRDPSASADGLADWLDLNVAKPAYLAGVVQPTNVFANALNGVAGRELVSKLPVLPLEPADSTGAEIARGVSSGLAGLWPYLLGGKLTSLGLRAGGRQLGLQGCVARVAANEATGLVLTAATIDCLRDVNPGETRLGNVMGGVAAFGVFGVGNHVTRNWSLAERAFLANPLIGAFGGEMQLRASRMISGGEITGEERLHAWVNGAATNFVLPWAQEGLSRGIDKLAVRFNKGLSTDRYAYYNNLEGQSAALDRELHVNPLARVGSAVEGTGSHIDLRTRMVSLDPKSGSGGAELGHELSHIRIAKAAEPRFRSAAELLKTGDVGGAEQAFKETRRWQEYEARRVGTQIDSELSGLARENGRARSSEHKTMAPLEASYEQRFDAEWRNFQSSSGRFRPQVEFHGPDGTAIIVIDSGFNIDSIDKTANIIGVYDLNTGAALKGTPAVGPTALRDFSGDALNHGSIVLGGDSTFVGLADRAPQAPFILIRAFADRNALLRTQWLNGEVSRPGWTEAYQWAVDLSRGRGLDSVANCAFGGYVHAMDGGGWESFQLGKVTGSGRPGHIVVAASGSGDGRAIHAAWQQKPGEIRVIDAHQEGTTRYNFWAGERSGESGAPSVDPAAWDLQVIRDGRLIHEYDGSKLVSNVWNQRKQITFTVDGEGPIQLLLRRRDGARHGSQPQRFDCWIATESAAFQDRISPVTIPEPAVFPHVLAVGLQAGRYSPGQTLVGSKPDILLPGSGPISFRTPEVTSLVADLLNRKPTLDVDAVRLQLGKYPISEARK